MASVQPIGQQAIHAMLGGNLPEPFTQSYVGSSDRRTHESGAKVVEYYPALFSTDGSLRAHLRFALKNEPLDLRIVYAALRTLGGSEISEWVRSEPSGVFSRRAWFLYEYFSGDTLDLPDARANVPYTNALDEKRHYTASPRNCPRYRVRDNLLGNPGLCPTLRRTAKLETMTASRLRERVAAVAGHYAPETLARATNFLYTKETRSSFAIEGESPGHSREERFVTALQRAGDFDVTDKSALIALQNGVVDPRYAEHGWRTTQNFVAETTRGFGQKVHFICPRPEDVPGLMDGWRDMSDRLLGSPGLDAVLAAAVTAFSFVFLHPFGDGNGRIHRFLIHQMLTKRGFTPPGFIFPVSTAILRERRLYDAVLELFSRAIQPAIDWEFTESGGVTVRNDTLDLYRFFDATPQAEYLYDRVAETIQTDLKEELDFLTLFDAAFAALRRIVDMPDRKAQFLLRLCLQNNGRLSKNKWKEFAELTDDEISRVEGAIAGIQTEIRTGDTE